MLGINADAWALIPFDTTSAGVSPNQGHHSHSLVKQCKHGGFDPLPQGRGSKHLSHHSLRVVAIPVPITPEAGAAQPERLPRECYERP